MAYGFGSTLGTGATDRLVSARSVGTGPRTIFIVAYRNGPGGNNFGRIWDAKATDVNSLHSLYFSNSDTKLYFQRRMGVDALWTVAAPSAAAWHPIGVSFDDSSTANDPTIYIDGSSVTVTETTTPTAAGVASSDPYWLGNRPADSARAWDGHLAEFAVWNSILTAGQHASLAAGASPTTIDAGNLVLYVPLVSNATATVGSNLTVTGALVTSHPPGFSSGGGSIASIANHLNRLRRA